MKVSCEEVHGAEGVVRCQDEEYIERGMGAGGRLEVAFGARYLTYTLTCNGSSFLSPYLSFSTALLIEDKR